MNETFDIPQFSKDEIAIDSLNPIGFNGPCDISFNILIFRLSLAKVITWNLDFPNP